MLRTLLCEDRIDAALITRWDEHSPLGPAVTLVTSPEEFSSSQKSKYCQVPWGEALGDLEAFEGRIAVVGLPCHIQGLENARRLRPAFCRNIVLKVGLLCDRILSFAAIDRLLETAGVPACEVAEFEYRHKAWRGWPGDVCIKARDGRRYNLPRKERMRIKDIHTPARCWVCPDKFNVLADVSFGDGYGGPESKEGMSLALVRTQAGAEALSLALPHLDIVEVALDKGLAEHKPEAREARSNAGVSALLKLRPAAACPLLDKLWTGEAPSRKSLRRIKYALRVESADTPERARSLRGRWQGRKFRRFLRRLFG
jgi:coenzyme F420-reducing hydrogenase beta subunit